MVMGAKHSYNNKIKAFCLRHKNISDVFRQNHKILPYQIWIIFSAKICQNFLGFLFSPYDWFPKCLMGVVFFLVHGWFQPPTNQALTYDNFWRLGQLILISGTFNLVSETITSDVWDINFCHLGHLLSTSGTFFSVSGIIIWFVQLL